jgi:hypothetical protein
MINFRKTLAATLAVATIGAGIAATSTPAAAFGHFGGGHFGGGHGFGGGFHHGGFRGAGFGLAAVGLGLAGAAAASSYYYGGYDCYRQPVVDYYGNVVGYSRVCR